MINQRPLANLLRLQGICLVK